MMVSVSFVGCGKKTATVEQKEEVRQKMLKNAEAMHREVNQKTKPSGQYGK